MNHEPTLKNYVIGFIGSLILTLGAYVLVTQQLLAGWQLAAAVGAFAVTQFVVQMVCFLHLGAERRPRWKFVAFWFMVLVVVILVAGSIWIMTNLNYHMMNGVHGLETSIIKDEGFKP